MDTVSTCLTSYLTQFLTHIQLNQHLLTYQFVYKGKNDDNRS